MKPEFDKRNTKIIGLSVDPVSDHSRWAKDIQETQGQAPNYPIIGDPDLKVAKLYDMIHPNATGTQPRTAADNATVRSVFIIGPDKKVKAMLVYPMTSGRDFNGIAAARLVAAERQGERGHARELEAGPGSHHPTSVSDDKAKRSIRRVQGPVTCVP
jgi:alkyl hydroperoxide reductase subunit AhpC